MNAAQYLECIRVKALRTQRHAIDARLGIALELAALYRPWVRIQGDFRAVRELNPLLERADQAGELGRSEQARRPAAKKYAVDPAPRHACCLGLEIPDQRVDIRDVGLAGLQLMRIEIAVRAFAHAPRHVHVQREWHIDDGLIDHGGAATGSSAANCSRSARSALPRWPKRFFSVAGSSAAVLPKSGSQKYGS